jgi:cytosine/adenosine deaminase-related metal-dependent hydrolase
MHLGESEDEARYFEEASGPLFELIAERGKSLKHNFVSALQELESKGFFDDRIMAIHGNYFSRAELALCGQRGVSLVHCPFSHQYFGHQDFPLMEALAAEVNVALGTDSLASAPTLSMLEVMRQIQKTHRSLSQEQIFAMATLGGAQALKMTDLIGEVRPEKKADLIGVRMGSHVKPLDALFAADHAEFSMIDGVRLME